MSTVVVGLNSLYRSGTSAFMLHLVHESDWDLILVNPEGEPQEDDIDDIPPGIRYTYVKDEDFEKSVKGYSSVVIGAPRWGGEYDFISGKLDANISVVVHDLNDNRRMGLSKLLQFVYPTTIFHFDTVTGLFMNSMSRDHLGFRVIRMRLPFSKTLMPGPVSEGERKYVVCASRPTPSKGHDVVQASSEGHPLRVLSRNGVYTWQEASDAYNLAFAAVDAWTLDEPYDAPSYTTIEAWHHGVPFLCNSQNFGGEMIPGVSCLELNPININLLSRFNSPVARTLRFHGKAFCELHDASLIRREMERWI